MVHSIRRLAVLAFLVLGTLPAAAATVSTPVVPFSFGNDLDFVPDLVPLPGFNSALGTLTGVEITVNSNVFSRLPGMNSGRIEVFGMEIFAASDLNTTALPVGGTTSNLLDAPFGIGAAQFQLPSYNLELFISTLSDSWIGDAQATYTFAPIPVPGALPLMVLGLAGLALVRRRRA